MYPYCRTVASCTGCLCGVREACGSQNDDSRQEMNIVNAGHVKQLILWLQPPYLVATTKETLYISGYCLDRVRQYMKGMVNKNQHNHNPGSTTSCELACEATTSLPCLVFSTLTHPCGTSCHLG